ncbi:MAG TPA: tetratricopeptide repeat protein, partial [Polyangiaceae bacterium]|nr:tetratricopeptide repeat protein [Polyangiaceae bacterium]
VLRAAAMSGKVFDAAIVAALLDSDELAVLEQLQTVRDAGLPIEDLGRGRFRIPQVAAQHLLGSILPSLAEAWHRRLAQLLGHAASKETEDEGRVVSPSGSVQSPTAASRLRPALPTRQSRVEDPLRAARHASAVGDSDLAAEQYVAAARRAAEMGAPHDAFALAEQALELLDAVPGTESRRVLRIRALAARARIQWQAAGPSEQFSLPAALATADAAKALLVDQDPSDLRADLGALCGGICYDIGDKQALERALAELSGVSRELLAADDPIGAARLLNDEAAVWVRLGDVVRANYLLKKSREIFARLTPQNAVARQELAETDHMLARLILHVDARPGREEDAVRIGIEHALAAEEAYRDLSLPREQARVWETLGRLELLRGRGDAAIERLEASVRAQQRFGDVLGLARSAAALSDLLAAAGRSRDALALLGQSIAFNLDKGSPLGLAFNRAALEALATKSPDDEPEQRAFLESLRKQVRAGEALLGRADLPEDARTNQDIRGNSG